MGTVLKPKCAKCGAPTLRRPHPCGLHFCSEACERATKRDAEAVKRPAEDDRAALISRALPLMRGRLCYRCEANIALLCKEEGRVDALGRALVLATNQTFTESENLAAVVGYLRRQLPK